jgi:DHA2 family multidrug resistance protein
VATEASARNGATPRVNKAGVMATSIGASALYSMNLNIVAISLPHMQGTFSATPDQIAWVVTSFILGLTMMVACIGWIGERLGRTRVFLSALFAFVGASVMCGNATSLEAEVFWRFMQGVSGAAIMPLSLAILLDAYPRKEHGYAIGVWGLGNMLGPVFAPPIGGIITEVYGWPAVFDLNVPAGALCILGTILFVPKVAPVRGKHLDVVGMLTLVVGLGFIQLMVNRGARLDWFSSPEIVVEAAAGLFLLYIFVVHILTTDKPFLDITMFRDRNFTAGIIMIMSFGLYSFLPLVTLPIFLRNLLNYPVEIIGMMLVPRALGVVIGNLTVVRFMPHLDPRILLLTGLAFVVGASWNISTWTLDVGVWEVAINGVFQGIGNGFLFVTVNALTFATLPDDKRSQGVPLFFLGFNICSSIGIATMFTYWVEATQLTHAVLSESASPLNELFRSGQVPSAWDPKSSVGAATLDSLITRQASLIAFEVSFQVVAIVAALTTPLVFLFPGRQKKDTGA